MLLKYGDKKKKGKMIESPLYRYGMGMKRKEQKGHEKGRSSGPSQNANGISNRIYLWRWKNDLDYVLNCQNE